MNISGYASLFGVKDNGRDIVEPGAFKASLHKRATSSLRLLWQHNQREPIGIITSVKEDRKGLYFEAEILEETMYGQTAASLVARKGLGVSIGYKTIDFRLNDKERVRHLEKVDLREISLVTMPMNEHCAVWQAPMSRQISGSKSEEMEQAILARARAANLYAAAVQMRAR